MSNSVLAFLDDIKTYKKVVRLYIYIIMTIVDLIIFGWIPESERIPYRNIYKGTGRGTNGITNLIDHLT